MEKLTASQVLARNRAERSRAEPTSGDPLLCAGVFALRASAKPWKDSDVSAAVQSDSMPSPEGCLSRTEHEPLPNMWCRQAAVAPYDVASAALTAGDFLFLFLSYSSFSLFLSLSLSLSLSLCLSLSLSVSPCLSPCGWAVRQRYDALGEDGGEEASNIEVPSFAKTPSQRKAQNAGKASPALRSQSMPRARARKAPAPEVRRRGSQR